MSSLYKIFEQNLVRDVINLVEEGLELYKSELKNQGHVNTGKLRDSGEVKVEIKGTFTHHLFLLQIVFFTILLLQINTLQNAL